mgnify:CR=1 FL=1|tara:strand:- start:1246 stop:1590 length:345 start_codon:yes stop_codon:yes gene_type:complete
MGFKSNFNQESRLCESKKILSKYPTRIPVIVEKKEDCSFNSITKNKYLVPKEMLMNQFIFIIRKRIKLNPSESLFVLVNNSLVSSNTNLSEIYEQNKDSDGFLYMIYTSENTFG